MGRIPAYPAAALAVAMLCTPSGAQTGGAARPQGLGASSMLQAYATCAGRLSAWLDHASSGAAPRPSPVSRADHDAFARLLREAGNTGPILAWHRQGRDTQANLLRISLREAETRRGRLAQAQARANLNTCLSLLP